MYSRIVPAQYPPFLRLGAARTAQARLNPAHSAAQGGANQRERPSARIVPLRPAADDSPRPLAALGTVRVAVTPVAISRYLPGPQSAMALERFATPLGQIIDLHA